jgi:hypothetical protein
VREARLLADLLVEHGLVERQRGKAEEVQQQLALGGPGGRCAVDHHAADGMACRLEREALPHHHVRIGVAGAAEQDRHAVAVHEHPARLDGDLRDEHLGDLAADVLELERAGQLGGQLLETVQLGQLLAHPLLEQAVLDRHRDAVGDRAELLLVAGLERVGATADQQQIAERAVADHEARPGDVAPAVAGQPVGDRHRVRRAAAHGLRGAQAVRGGHRERAVRQVGRSHAPLPPDRDARVAVEHEHRDVGGEQLGHLDRRPLDERLEHRVVGQHRDDAREPRRAQQRARRVLLGPLEPLAQADVLGGEPHGIVRVGGIGRHGPQNARIATLELWTPVEPSVRPNSPNV